MKTIKTNNNTIEERSCNDILIQSITIQLQSHFYTVHTTETRSTKAVVCREKSDLLDLYFFFFYLFSTFRAFHSIFPLILFTAIFVRIFNPSALMPSLIKGNPNPSSFILFYHALLFVHVNFPYSRAFLAKVGRMKLALWISAL